MQSVPLGSQNTVECTAFLPSAQLSSTYFLLSLIFATEPMGVPKEGSSAEITIATGIVSALKKLPVRNDIAMTGEITIMGKVLAVGGIQQKIRAAYDAGVKEVLIPADNFKEAQELPSYILDTMKLTPMQTVDEVLRHALVGVASK